MTTTLLNNRYQIIQILGIGGFSETFLAEDTYLPSRHRCVIKQLKPYTNDPQMYQLLQQRFGREAAILEKLGLRSDQIPKLYAYFFENGQFYLVQEWIQGQTLTRIVEANGPLSETAVRDILVSLVSVLDYVHNEGIIHRDVKPSNIILRHWDGKPVLIDFGAGKETVAALVHAQGKLNPSIVLGTPGFMSPEQASGRPSYTSDLYSLGLTAIYALTGKLPQELEVDPQNGQILWQQYARKVSSSLAAVLDRAIQSHPRDRYSNARKMLLDVLESAASILPPDPSTQATVIFSPTQSRASSQTTPVRSPQKASAINRPSSLGNAQKPLILGSLFVGGLLSTLVLIGLTRNQLPSSSIVTSSSPASSLEQPIAKSTPTPESQSPTSKPAAAPPAPVTPQASAPATKSAQSSPNENQNDSASNTARDRTPGFPIGTSYSSVKAALGNPTQTTKGFWSNTRALVYQDVVPNQISAGYLFDRGSGRLRQTEIAFAQSVKPEVMQATLKKMLDDRALIGVNQGLRRVYQRRTNKYSFNTGELKGVIQRDERDRIYIGVWEADLH
jgi:serine/threonine-protein kinase